MRRKCQACRLKKCKAVGMRQECVVPEVQCAIKRESKRAQKDKDKPNSTTRDCAPNGTNGPQSQFNIHQTAPISRQPQQQTNLHQTNHHMPPVSAAVSTQQHHHQQQTQQLLPPHPQNYHMNTSNNNQQTLHPSAPSHHQPVPAPQTQAHVRLAINNNHHHQNSHHLNAHQNHHLEGNIAGGPSHQHHSVTAAPIAATTQQSQMSMSHLGIASTNHLHTSLPNHHQTIAHQSNSLGVSPNQTSQPKYELNAHIPAPSHNLMNGLPVHGQFTPTSLHSSPPNHLSTSALNDPLLASSAGLAALHQTSSLSPGQYARMPDELNQKFSDKLPQNKLARSQKLLADRMTVLEDLIRIQEEFESPREEDIRQVPPYIEGQGQSQLEHFTEMTILTVRLIVEFAKKVHGFDLLMREDQITLLKASAGEIMMLRSTRWYDIKTDSILFANNQPFTRENYRKAHIGEIADAMFNFCRSTVILRLNSAEYALITALIIFSERPNLKEPEKIERIQEYYLELMHAYVEAHENSERCKFARLLSLLPELRALSIVNSDVCFSLKIKHQKLPAFLAEIWDVAQDEEEEQIKEEEYN